MGSPAGCGREPGCGGYRQWGQDTIESAAARVEAEPTKFDQGLRPRSLPAGRLLPQPPAGFLLGGYMAWIKVEHSLPGKPKVMELAELLGVEADTVVGHLIRFWIWVDQNVSRNCPGFGGTKAGLDREAGRTGFCDAMIEVGWLTLKDGRFEIPDFDDHLSQSAKTRADEAKRKQNQRMSRSDRDMSGTIVPPTTGREGGPDKRREEKNNKTETETRARTRGQASAESQPPATDPVLADLDGPADPVVIPECMQAPEVLRAARQWFRHLQTRAPERVPQADSEGLRAFWVYAGGLGPDRFLKAVAFSVGRGYANLVEEVEQDARGKQSPRGAAPGIERLTPNQQRERNNRRAFEAVFGSAPGDWEGSGSVVRREADRLLAAAALDLGDCAGLLSGGAGGGGGNEGGSEL